MRNSIKLVATLAVGGAFLIAGCGGSDDTTSTSGASGASGATGASSSASSGSAPDKATFIKQADALCKTGIDAQQQAFKGLGGNGKPSPDQIKQAVQDTMVPAIQTELDGINNLTPPAGDEDQVNQITADAQAALDKIKADPTLVTGNANPFAKADQEAKAYGLTVCGS